MVTKKPIAIIGTAGAVDKSWTISTENALLDVGTNTGNLCFQYGAYNAIDEEKRLIPFDFDPEAVRKNCRLIVVPSANFLYGEFDFSNFASRLEASGLPLLVLGLGIQATRDVSEIKLKPGTEHLLHVMADQTKTLFVRGSHTAKFLEQQGIKNFDVLGCPSNFINPAPDLGLSIGRRLASTDDSDSAIALVATFYPQNAALEQHLFRQIGPRLQQITCQETAEAISFARGGRNRAIRRWFEENAGFLSALPAPERTAASRYMRVYFSIENWLEAYRNVDFVLGTRIHGCVMGWQAGRPSCLVAHDLRTRELAETMSLPLLLPQEAVEGSCLSLARQRAEASAARYDANRVELAKRFVGLLVAADVKPSPALVALSLSREIGGGSNRGQLIYTADPHADLNLGFLEEYSSKRILGWVSCLNDVVPDLQIRVNGNRLADIKIGKERSDTRAMAREFSVAMPSELKGLQQVTVEATVDGGKHIGNSPVVAPLRQEGITELVAGSGGFLFLRQSLDVVTDAVPADAKILASWREFLLDVDETAATLASTFVLLIIPDKACLYSEELPAGFQVAPTRLAMQIVALADRLGLKHARVVYPLERMLQAKIDPVSLLYPPGDSHPSHRGSAVLAHHILDLLRPGARQRTLADEHYRTVYATGDLAYMQGGISVTRQLVYDRKFLCRRLDRQDRNGLEAYRSLDPEAWGNLLFLRDWAGAGMEPILAEHFASMRVRFGFDVDADAWSLAASDTVILQRCERFLQTPAKLV